MPTINTAQGEIYYAEKRADDPRRPPLILIHGAGSSHLMWPGELRRLPGQRVMVIDLPGHGRSPGPGHKSIMAYTESVAALLAALDIEQAIIAGHSMGGAIAQMLAIHHAERVAGLILIATGARLKVNPDLLNTILEDTPTAIDMVTRWAWGPTATDEQRELGRRHFLETSPAVTYGDYVACNEFAILEQLPRITAPVLIIGGTADKMTPFRYSETLAEHIPNATLVKLENAGHMMPLEYPQAIADHILHWLDQLD